MATASNPRGNAARAGEQMAQKAQDTMHRLQDAGGDAVQALKDAGMQAKNVAQEQVENLRGAASEYWEQGCDRAQELEQTLEGQIRKQPLRSTLIALGIGFLVGACLMRR